MTVHYVDVQHTGATTFDGFDLFSKAGEISRKNRGGDFDIPVRNHWFGVGRAAAGRLFSLTGGREFEFRRSRFTLLRGVALTFGIAFALPRFALTTLVLPFVFLLAFALSLAFFGLGFLGLVSLFDDVFVLRFSLGSGVTVSGVSPSLVTRLMSMATV